MTEKIIGNNNQILPNNKLVDGGSCLKNVTSLDNWQDMHNFILPGNHNNNRHYDLELRNMLLTKESIISQESLPEFCTYIKNYLTENNYSVQYKKTIIKLIEKIKAVLQKDYYPEDYLEILGKEEFLETFLKKHLQKSNKIYIKFFYKRYFDYIGYGRLDPHREKLLRLIADHNLQNRAYKTKQKTYHPLIIEFKKYLLEKNVNDVKKYIIIPNKFLKIIMQHKLIQASKTYEVNVKLITEDVVKTYQEHLNQRIKKNEISAGYANLCINVITKWFKFLKLQGLIHANPTNKLKIFPYHRKEFKLITENDFSSFFNAIIENSLDILRDLTLFICMGTTGIRIKEILNIKIKDINFDTGTIKIIRKGNKEQLLPLSGVAILFLELYLQSKINPQADDPVFLNNFGRKMREQTARNYFHKYAKLANISDYQGACHAFRHYCFTELYAENYENLNSIKVLAGWKSFSQINSYIHGRKEKIPEILQNVETIGADIYEGN